MSDSNENRLFLYLDLLGFTSLLRDCQKIERIFRILDGSNIHRDANYKTIVFSDTVLAYNQHISLTPNSKEIELMYLIEFAQDIRQRLTGEEVFFRAIITEGPFRAETRNNFQSFYGDALVKAHKEEKELVGIGLFVDRSLRDLHSVFRYKQFSEKYDFVYTTQQISRLEYFPSNYEKAEKREAVFPLPTNYLTDEGAEYFLYPELRHLIEIYHHSLGQPEPSVRAKYICTWRMYELAYPKLTGLIAKSNFDLSMISGLDWSGPKRQFEEDRVSYAK